MILAWSLACSDEPECLDCGTATSTALRVATFNASLFREREGRLLEDLSDPEHEQAQLVAAILQEVRPDVLLLNEVDWDPDGVAAQLLRENFLSVAQGGREPLELPFGLVPETNTGVASGVDLDGDGEVVTEPGSEAYGDDALGFGEFPGQYGLVVLSRYPLTGWRSFRTMLWRDLPDSRLPVDYYSAEAIDVLPLSSKTHVDVSVDVDGNTLHFLVSHPTPPTFDGPEDHNGLRNHDEIGFWARYVDAPADGAWPVDDDGVAGGLGDGWFVIAGDQNADPSDGDSTDDPMAQLLDHPRVVDPLPTSVGGAEQAALQGGRNDGHATDPALDTADFADDSVGNLRIDYVLPSADLGFEGAGVFWPAADDEDFALVGTYPFPVSDHRLVWVDVLVGAAP